MPAAITAMAPFDQAYSTASQKAQPSTPWSAPPPRLRLMTSAPWSVAQRIPAATSSAEPGGGAASRRRRSCSRGPAPPAAARPAPRRPRRGRCRWPPARCPATWVPWPLSSCPDPPHAAALPFAPMQLMWPTSCGARSSWARSTPESTTAIVIPSPVPFAHAPGAPMRSRPHWSPCSNTGSSGVDPPAPVGPDARDQREPGTAEAHERSDGSAHPPIIGQNRRRRRAMGSRASETTQDGDDLAEHRHVARRRTPSARAGRSTAAG